jgi:hypothetical protein
MNIDCSEHEDLSWRGGNSLRHWLSASDGGDPILTESDVLPKIGFQSGFGSAEAAASWQQSGPARQR